MIQQTIPVKLNETYAQAGIKYGWGVGVEGLTVEYNLVTIAEMADKALRFVIKRRKKQYVINATKAKEVAKLYGSFFTRKDMKVIIVIPCSQCEVIRS